MILKKQILALVALGLLTSLSASASQVYSRMCNQSKSCSFACPEYCNTSSEDVATGSFESIGNHKVVGSVRIEKIIDNYFLTLNPDFSSATGPDLRVVLRDSRGITPMKIISILELSQGEQKYPLSLNSQELSLYDEVVIYCAKFHVDFGIAKLID